MHHMCQQIRGFLHLKSCTQIRPLQNSWLSLEEKQMLCILLSLLLQVVIDPTPTVPQGTPEWDSETMQVHGLYVFIDFLCTRSWRNSRAQVVMRNDGHVHAVSF